ncbi:MAG: aminoacyl-tRNA hydrolase [Kofleriaceae bacterium]|nr:MAG: aminoacyl-tRNA hydrolase [Kofleriaceae bacterium]MBZ0238893.1 aminoacyl-tRNA hydrolase [Kofleriaceae bacterium]
MRYPAAVSDIVVTPRIVIPGDELTEAFVRSSGPGGQNVNKVASKVELRWTPQTSAALSFDDRAYLLTKLGGRLTLDGELIVTSDRYRDQPRNRADAAEKLAAIVRAALARPKPRKKTKPSRGAKERRIASKKKRGEIKSARRARFD